MANRSRPSNGIDQDLPDATIAELVTTSFGATSPASDRLTEIIEKRKGRR